MAELVQVVLRSGPAVRTCWVAAGVKAGDEVTLANSEDPARWWTVVRVEDGRKTAAELAAWSAGGAIAALIVAAGQARAAQAAARRR